MRSFASKIGYLLPVAVLAATVLFGLMCDADGFLSSAASLCVALSRPRAVIDSKIAGHIDEKAQTQQVVVSLPEPVDDEPAETATTVSSLDELPDLETAQSKIPAERRGAIEQKTYGNGSSDSYFYYENGCFFNCTDFSGSEMAQEAAKECTITPELVSGQPQVLVIHTHTTESFDRFDAGIFDADYPTRSTDDEMNMIAVGESFVKTLESEGVAAVHACEYHDYPSYNDSYSRSRETARDYLERYPSIKIIIDLHRDGIEYEDGTRVKPVTLIDGKKAAQVMIICGADDGTMGMPNFRQNLRFAARLQSSIETLYPTLARPALFDYRHYNQDMTTGSLLIEVGSHASTLAEAKYSAELVAHAMAAALKSLA